MPQTARPAIPIQHMFSVRQLAELLNLSKVRVRNWINSGEIKGFKARGKLFVTRKELVKWVRSKETDGG